MDEQEKRKIEEQDVDNAYNELRTIGAGITATILAICASVIILMMNSYDEDAGMIKKILVNRTDLRPAIIILFANVAIAALLANFFSYLGNKYLATHKLLQFIIGQKSGIRNENIESQEELRKISNLQTLYFGTAEWALRFVFGIIITSIIIFCCMIIGYFYGLEYAATYGSIMFIIVIMFLRRMHTLSQKHSMPAYSIFSSTKYF